jgi:serine/threonine-protein kinase
VTAPQGAIGPGSEIAGYRIEEQIGEGGMAIVYRARDAHLDRPVALKLLTPALAADTAFRQRFIRESRAASAVDHPNIIPIYEAGNAGGALFIAMRYVQGGDLGSLLEHNGPLPAARAWAIISQVAAALDAAHEHGLIHRDVKPANILLDAGTAATGPVRSSPASQPEHVYLSDFGISKQSISGTSTLTLTGQFVGTLDYIAPEQIDGIAVDGRADLYSLGCAAFELLSGMPPFRRGRGLALIKAHLSEPPPSLTAHRASLPPAVDRVLARAMAKSPDERYATCAEFAVELGRSLDLIPVEPEPLRQAAGSGADGHPWSWQATQFAGQAPATPGGQHGGQPGQGLPHAQAAPPDYRQHEPAWQPQEPRRRSRGLVAGMAVAAATAVLAAGAVVAVVLSSHGQASPAPAPAITSAAPAPAPSPSAEAAAMSNLLTSGTKSSIRLTDAADNVGSCTDLPHSTQQIRQVRDQRQTEYGQAQNLSADAIQNGAELKSELTRSLLDSLNADNAYLTWAQQQAASCQPGSQSSEALAADRQAVSDKGNFVALWNPIAARYGLPPTSVGSI